MNNLNWAHSYLLHLGRTRKYISKNILYFEETEVTRLLFWSFLTRLHPWAVFQHLCRFLVLYITQCHPGISYEPSSGQINVKRLTSISGFNANHLHSVSVGCLGLGKNDILLIIHWVSIVFKALLQDSLKDYCVPATPPSIKHIFMNPKDKSHYF